MMTKWLTFPAAAGYNEANYGERAARRVLKKRDIFVIGGVALLALAVLLLRPLLATPAATGQRCYIQLTVDGVKQPPQLLEGERDIEIRQEDGAVNVLHLTENSVRMQSSTCHNQLCVQQGEVTLQNRDMRPLQSLIVCLPNRVSVELLSETEAAAALEAAHE